MDERDIITANSVSEFPVGTASSKERIVAMLEGLHTENPEFWASIKTIAKESETSDVYTRNVMNKLLEENKVEMGRKGSKVYFRLNSETTSETATTSSDQSQEE